MRHFVPLALLGLTACYVGGWPGLEPPRDPGDGGVIIDTPDIGPGRFTFHEDVAPILERRCGLCHGASPKFAANTAMATYTDTQAMYEGQPLYMAIAERVRAERHRMPPPSQPQLSNSEIGIIEEWAQHGAPEGTRTSQYTWIRDVEPIVRVKCQLCHSRPLVGGAPYPLQTYADVKGNTTSGMPLYEVMAFRVVAPQNPMPPPSQPQLTDEEKQIIALWALAGAPEGEVSAPTWYQDVQPIVSSRCGLCHGNPPAFGAPRSIGTWADTQAVHPTLGIPVHEVMAQRVGAPSSPMPPAAQPQLTTDQIDVIKRWSAGGGQEGVYVPPPDGGVPDAGSVPDSGPGIPWLDGGASPSPGPGLRFLDTHARLDQDNNLPYPMQVTDTEYACWSYRVGGSGTQHAVYFEPILDNIPRIHHVMLFLDRSNAETSEEPVGPTSCLGFPFQADGINLADFIAGWFPGRGPDWLPDGVGVDLQPSDRIIIQMHYDNVTEPGLTDFSGFRTLITNETGLQNAGVLGSGYIWLTPLNGTNETRETVCTVSRAFTGFAVIPHMHAYGTRIVFDVQRAGTNQWQVITEIPAWSFDDQPIVPVPNNMQRFNPGDRLRTRCFWNTRGNTVRQGEASNDEMCFNFLYHYPLIPDAFTSCVVTGP